jgi:hypothetical protein
MAALMFVVSPIYAQEPTPSAKPDEASASMTVWGPVWVDARPAGTTVRAFVGETECASIDSILPVDVYITTYHLVVPSSEERDGCGKPGAIITFTVGDAPVDGAAAWQSGGTARLDLVAGPPFARYSGEFTWPDATGTLAVEPLIGEQVCGEQLNPLLGGGPSYGYDVVVDPATLQPGCGVPGATVRFRLVRQEEGRRTVLADATGGEVTWEPGTQVTGHALTFATPPNVVLPASGDGTTSSGDRGSFPVAGIGVGIALIVVGALGARWRHARPC